LFLFYYSIEEHPGPDTALQHSSEGKTRWEGGKRTKGEFSCGGWLGSYNSIIFESMKPNNNPQNDKMMMINTPNTFAFGRSRLLSFNTPQLSPLRMGQSPYMGMGDHSIFDNQLGGAEFRLEEGPPMEENVQPVQESSDESVEEMSFPRFPEDGKVTKE
jgi:hypothetical protein